MKKIKIILMFLATVHLYSCGDDFLKPNPTSFVSGETFFANETELNAWLLGMYDGIQGDPSTSSSVNHGVQYEFQITEMRSDNTGTKSQEGQNAQFENYTVESTNGVILDYYRSFYNVIFRANTALENLDAATDANRAAIEAEARFIRGYAYFNLVRLFGDIPMIDKVIAPDETEVSFTRVSAATIYENVIVPDLENAVAGLTHDASNKNRASKGAAQALLAKVHLTLGNFSDAQTLLSAVIGTGDYALESDFANVFTNEGNDEVIFAIGYVPDNQNDAQGFSAEWLNAVGRTTGINYLTIEAVTALNAMGGDRALKSYREDQAQLGKFQVVKYLPDSGNPILAGNDWIVLRYSDVLLMYVEAAMAGGASTTDGAALAYFQQVRSRALITTPVSSISSQELLDERRVELAFENHRFFDLVRFGVAESVLGNFAAANGYVFSANDLLLPIPQVEISLSKGVMSQNPGY